MNKINLNATIDATIWTNEWMRIINEHPNISTDKFTMFGWFAHALMTGYDKGFIEGVRSKEEENIGATK